MDSRELAHTSSVKALTDLLARLEATEGADRELDALICAALKYLTGSAVHSWAANWQGPWEARGRQVHLLASDGRSNGNFTSEALTASLDASLALVERVLPGWGYDITYRAAWGNCTACVIANDRKAMPYTGAGQTPALALLTALVRALISQSRLDAERQPEPRDGPKP